jgi:hypothetical protein
MWQGELPATERAQFLQAARAELAVDHPAARFGSLAQHRVMPRDRLRHRLGMLLPQLGATRNIGE